MHTVPARLLGFVARPVQGLIDMKRDPTREPDPKLPPPDPDPQNPEPRPPVPDPDVPELGPDVLDPQPAGELKMQPQNRGDSQ